MNTDTILLVVTFGCMLIGLIGTFIPMIPGVILVWVGLLVSYFSSNTTITILGLIITGAVTALVMAADNIFPILMTKAAGGSKAGVIGSTIGAIVGLCFSFIGLIICPFIGALIGELIYDHSNFNRAFHAAFATFKGYLLGLGLKLITCCAFFIYLKLHLNF